MNSSNHIPVLLNEVVSYLKVRKGEKYIDATVGLGGHTREVIKLGGKVLGIDRDQDSLQLLKLEEGFIKLVYGNFSDLEKIAKKHNFTEVAGILFDLGLSSWQIEDSGRGLSFRRGEPLDMRMDRSRGITAADLLNLSTQAELYEIFSKFAEEQHSGRIAQAVVSTRPIKTTSQLRSVIEKAVRGSGKAKIKRVTKIFQALRIAVNKELENLSLALPQALDLLQPQGRLLVISFHSLEDRTVKQFFRKCTENQVGKLVTKKAIRPSRGEIESNKRSASAKLRVLEKL